MLRRLVKVRSFGELDSGSSTSPNGTGRGFEPYQGLEGSTRFSFFVFAILFLLPCLLGLFRRSEVQHR